MTPTNGPQSTGANRVGNLPGNLFHRLILIAPAIGLLGCAPFVNAAPRPALPPFPERTLMRWTFDEALERGVESAWVWDAWPGPVVESWSGYALVRSGKTQLPLNLAALDSQGQAQVPVEAGSVRFWFRPDWASQSLGGTGPGDHAMLLRMGAAGLGWSLYCTPEGDGLYLTAHAQGEGADWFGVPIQLRARQWRLITLTWSAEGTRLYVDWELAAQGPGWSWGGLKELPVLTLGSDEQGGRLAQGEFEELTSLDWVAGEEDLLWYYRGHWRQTGLGPIKSWEAELAGTAEASLSIGSDGGMVALTEEDDEGGAPEPPGGGGGEPVDPPDPGPPGWTLGELALFPPVFTGEDSLSLTATNTTAGAQYDLFAITNLVSTNWWWLTRGGINQTNFSVSSLPEEQCYFILGTMQDNDGDGLTDAYENLVSHTSPGSWTSADSDGDGMPDAWELAQGTHPQLVDGGEDRDGDGATNLQEYRAGTSAGLAEAWAVWVGRPSGRSSVP
jgi:hypothetical protein